MMNYLRALEPEDLDLMYIIENDLEVSRYTSTNVPLSRYVLKQYIEESHNDLYKDSQVRLTIINPDNGCSCGFLDITDLSAVNRHAQIGIVLMPEFRGRGIAIAALNEAMEYSKQNGLHQLYAIVAIDNDDAKTLFTNAGFNQTGILKDWLLNNECYTDAIIYNAILN